MKYKRKCFIFI